MTFTLGLNIGVRNGPVLASGLWRLGCARWIDSRLALQWLHHIRCKYTIRVLCKLELFGVGLLLLYPVCSGKFGSVRCCPLQGNRTSGHVKDDCHQLTKS